MNIRRANASFDMGLPMKLMVQGSWQVDKRCYRYAWAVKNDKYQNEKARAEEYSSEEI